MKEGAREVQYFLFGQHFAEGLRVTFAILLPALLFSYYNLFETGLTLSLGALCVNITDAPGPVVHRRMGMLYANLCIFVTAAITGFAQMNVYTMGLEVLLAAFFFSMLNVYGMRAAAVGSAGLLVMILNMNKPLMPAQVFPHALLILSGGIWYMTISLLVSAIRPYRLPQRMLGDCIREMAKFLLLKAEFYNTQTDLNDDYRKLVAQQIIVHEKQDAVREILFKTRQIVNESTAKGRLLVFTFIESVDLFEDITASYYDYKLIREQYEATGILTDIAQLIQQLAKEMDKIGFAIQSNMPYKNGPRFEEEIVALKSRINILKEEKESGTFLLKKILVNLRTIVKRIHDLQSYAANPEHAVPVQNKEPEHQRFIEHQSFSIRLLLDNLSFDSTLFRHAIRTAVVCVAGFVLSKALFYGQHSYWILLTIAFMMKPAYSLTKQRNVQRVIGTLGGGLVGILILLSVTDSRLLFFFLVLFMLGTYSFLRANYLVMVFCITPFILILFHFLGLGYISIVQERIVDTVIGCAIAFTASYLFLPKWESEQIKEHLQNMLQANLHYLQKVSESLWGHTIIIIDYKLARKEVYVHFANLSAAFQRMLSEPKSKQKNGELIHEFVVLNHILFSNIASIASVLLTKKQRSYPHDIVAPARSSLTCLCAALNLLDQNCSLELPPQLTEEKQRTEWEPDDQLLKEQLAFIQQVSSDIQKITEQISK